jgi:hypothetical protein
VSAEETSQAAYLIQQLLDKPNLRAAFRRDATGTCRRLGLAALAPDFEAAPDAVAGTLEVRESRSSLVGVIMAAAAESVSAAHFFEHQLPQWRGEAGHAVRMAHATHLGLQAVAPPDHVIDHGVEPPPPPPPPADAVAPGPGPVTAPIAVVPQHDALLAPNVLDDPAVHLSAAARLELNDPGMADRVGALLSHVQGHQVTIGRVDASGIEITQVDGKPVGPDNIAARDLAEKLSDLPPGQRPVAIGTPWKIGSAGFESGPGHLHRLTIDLPYDPAATDGEVPGAKALAAIAAAKRMLGTEYVWGGDTPSQGFDCSGLVDWAYGQAGVHLGRTTYQQVTEGHRVEWGHFQPGDLIFSNWVGGTDAEHVVMYIGHGKVIEAPHTGAQVHITDVSVFKSHFVAARRIVSLEHSASAAPAVGSPAGSTPGTPQTLTTPAVSSPAPAGAGPITGQTPAVGGGQFVDQVSPGAGAYPGDGASKEQIAAWMAAAARRHDLPPELPVMAALVESGLHNDQYGDADSLGYFQMRVSYWNGEYPNFAHRPDLQLRWFIDQAVALREKRIAEGYRNFGQDPASWGRWVADIEMPAYQYRGRYQLQLEAAQKLVGV